MSSRQLRKLQQQRELEQFKLRQQTEAVEGSEKEEEEEEDGIQNTINKPSLFASLAALQDADEDKGENEAEEDAEFDSLDVERLASSSVHIEEISSPKKSKKLRKKKKKSKAQILPKEHLTVNQGPDEIDIALKELQIKSGKNASSTAHNADIPSSLVDLPHRKTRFLLQIDSQNLKVANEMRNLFGRTALGNHDEAGGHVPGGGRRRQPQRVDLETALKGRHLLGRGFPEVTFRRNIFIQGKDDWPRATTGGLSMEELTKAHFDGEEEFTFVHDPSYKTVQRQFDVMVEIGEPMNLIALLQRNPYHISLLLQVSKIAKDQGDHALSSDLVERALFSFARATTSLFASCLSQGRSRLQFARRENREFWLAGYQYIKSLVMKGTYRTALEWAKLLLIVDVSERDPYCMLLMIHHLALRAHEFQWLLDLSESSVWRSTAAHEVEVIAYASHITPSLAFAALQLKDEVKCKSLLRESIEKLPWLFCRLFQELGLDKPPPSIWGAQPRTDAENLFTEIYVLQTTDLWNTPEATALLVEVAEATEKLDHKKAPKTDNSAITLDVARFVYLDNTPRLMALVPSSLLHKSNNSDSDPLPPDDDVDAPEGLSRYYDPIEALRRLIPGWIGNGGIEDERAISNIRRPGAAEDINRDEIENDGLETDSENDEEHNSDSSGGHGNGQGYANTREESEVIPGQLSAAGRLYNYLLGVRIRGSPSERPAEEESREDLRSPGSHP